MRNIDRPSNSADVPSVSFALIVNSCNYTFEHDFQPETRIARVSLFSVAATYNLLESLSFDSVCFLWLFLIIPKHGVSR